MLKKANLEQITVVIVVNQDLELLEGVQALLDLDLGVGQVALQLAVVDVWDVEELGATSSQGFDGGDDVFRSV